MPADEDRQLQGTVMSFDADSHAGTVVLDDGTTVAYDGAAFDAGGLRKVRPGQRVRLAMSGARVRLLTLVTIPDP